MNSLCRLGIHKLGTCRYIVSEDLVDAIRGVGFRVRRCILCGHVQTREIPACIAFVNQLNQRTKEHEGE